jgi:hypothetical protein
MPYIPPHLRPGYTPSIATVPVAEAVSSSHVKFPTNLGDSHIVSNVRQPEKMHSPATVETLGLTSGKKKILKLVAPITPNTAPLARPAMRISNYPNKFRTAVLRHLKNSKVRGSTKKSKRKVKTSRRAKPSKKAKKTHRKH